MGAIIGLTIIIINPFKPQQEDSSPTGPAGPAASSNTSPIQSGISGEKRQYTFVRAWGSEGSGEGEFLRPSATAIDDSQGYVYVADWDNNRVQVWAPSALSQP